MTKAQTKAMADAFHVAQSKAFDEADSEGAWRWQPSPRHAFELGFKAALESTTKAKKNKTLEPA